MIRLNVTERSYLVGTEAGSLLLRYAAQFPADTPADPVALHVFNERGQFENVVIPVVSGLRLLAEVTDEDFGPEPENIEALLFLRQRLAHLRATDATASAPPAPGPGPAPAPAPGPAPGKQLADASAEPPIDESQLPAAMS